MLIQINCMWSLPTRLFIPPTQVQAQSKYEPGVLFKSNFHSYSDLFTLSTLSISYTSRKITKMGSIGGHHIVLSIWCLASAAIIALITFMPYWCSSTPGNVINQYKTTRIGLFQRCEQSNNPNSESNEWVCHSFLQGLKTSSYPGWLIFNNSF